MPGRSPGRPALSFISFPHPPSPPGKGESQSLFRRGLRPRHPCTESPTALADAAMQEPGGGLARQVAGSSCLELYWLPPSPLPPFPAGRGSLKVYFAGGFAPGTPALNRLRHLQELPCRCPAGVPRRTTRRESLSFSFAANHRFSPRGCKGRSPLHKITKSLPLPRRGRGSGG